MSSFARNKKDLINKIKQINKDNFEEMVDNIMSNKYLDESITNNHEFVFWVAYYYEKKEITKICSYIIKYQCKLMERLHID